MQQPLTPAQQRLLLQTPDDDLLEVFKGRTRRWLRNEKAALVKTVNPKELMTVDLEKSKTNARLRVAASQYKTALAEADELRVALDTALRLQDNFKMGTFSIKTQKNTHEATAVALASDWHCEEPVDPNQVNGLNAFNLVVFETRAKAFFANLIELVRKERAAVRINNLVLWLGGDFITGNIHDDTSFQNQLGPIDALIHAQQTIGNGINTVLKALPDLKLIVPCSVGNHSRITKKQMIKSERENSLEVLMYRSLAQFFEGRAQFILPQGYHTYLDVHGYVLRFHHGHNIQYQGGIGGITVPVNKAIAGWNRSRTAHLDCFGHFHQRFDGGNFLANGSLIGYNEFALAIKASYEPPQQQFALIDSRHGKTVVAPILLT